MRKPRWLAATGACGGNQGAPSSADRPPARGAPRASPPNASRVAGPAGQGTKNVPTPTPPRAGRFRESGVGPGGGGGGGGAAGRGRPRGGPGARGPRGLARGRARRRQQAGGRWPPLPPLAPAGGGSTATALDRPVKSNRDG